MSTDEKWMAAIWFLIWLLMALILVGVATERAQGQDRLGWCALNTGPLAHEDSAYVRGGNTAWEYACLDVEMDMGQPGGWSVGVTVAPSVIMTWAIRPEEPISRWSWRPGYHAEGQKDPHTEMHVVWIMPRVGYAVDVLGPITLRPSVGLIQPASLRYRAGANVGPIPYLGLETELHSRDAGVSLEAKVAHQRPHAWTFMQDWSTPEHGVAEPREAWVVFVLLKVTARRAR